MSQRRYHQSSFAISRAKPLMQIHSTERVNKLEISVSAPIKNRNAVPQKGVGLAKGKRSMPLSKTTTDHEEIRRWAEARGGKPACVRRTGSQNDAGVLRINFPGYSGDNSLQEIGWDEFFNKFDQNGLALVFQEQTASGERSNFNKLVKRETAEQKNRPRSSKSTSSARSKAASTSRKPRATSSRAKSTSGARSSKAKEESKK